jgi:hypothetical protein
MGAAATAGAGARPAPGALRWIKPAVGLVVAGAFATAIARRMDWQTVRGVWASADAGMLALAVALLGAGVTARIARWWWMLRALEPSLPMSACVRPFLVSLAANNTLPFRAGDVVRATGFRGVLRAPAARVVGTLVVERLLDMLVLLTLFFAGLLGVAAGAVPAAFVTTGALLGAGCVGAVLALVLAPGPLRRGLHRLLARPGFAGAGWAHKLGDAADHFFDTLALVQSPRRALQLLGLSYLGWGLEGGMYAAVAWALHTAVAPAGPWFAMTTGTLATLIPSSPGYVGTFDYFAMLGLMAYGAARTAATANALLVHVILWVPVTAAGGLSALFPGAGARAAAPTPELAQ